MRNCPTKNTTGFFASWKSKLFCNRLRKFQNFSEKEKKKEIQNTVLYWTNELFGQKGQKIWISYYYFFFHFFPQNFSENSLYSKINPWQKSRINGKYLPLFLCCVVIWNSFAFYPYLHAFLAFFCHLQKFICLRYFYKKKFNLPQISSLATALKLY